MGATMRSVDWSQTPFGPVAQWPQSLRTALSMMLESRFAMVVAWGPELRFFYNDRYLPVLGDKHPESLGRPAAEIFPEVWHLIGPEFERARSGDPVAIDDWYLPITRNGYLENCWFTVSYSGIRDETGGIGGLLLVVAETTARVEGERRLATLRELAARAAEATTPAQACENAALAFANNAVDVPFALVYALDDDGRTARRLARAGLPPDHAAAPETIMLDDPDAVWPLANAPKAAVVVHDLVGLPGGPAAEPTHTAMLLPLTRPGLAHPYGVLVAGVCPRRALDDAYRGFFDLAADHIATAIGNAKALEEQRERAEALAEIDRVKTAFFSNVSHEFRTPLALMLGPLEDVLAGKYGELAPDLRQQHELMHRNTLRLHKLVNAMLDFSRIEAGRAKAVYEPTDLAALTGELAAMFRAAIERAGLDFVVDCAPLPEPVYVDREMWEKIVLNLLSNAFKFTFHGRIRVILRPAGEFVELVVRDTGCGIPSDELPRVFERFHRVERTRSRTHEGTGIGLALALELARLHGGTIDVESELGSGTSFTVRIRCGRAHLPTEHVAAGPRERPRANAFIEEALRWLPDATPARPEPAPVRSGARVLIADDNADMREYLCHVLEPYWQVTTVADGAAALAEIRRSPPDIVVSDVMMPVLDGFGLIAALRADAQLHKIPVVIVSARAGDEARVEGLSAGADDYLVKPFHARELIARVTTQLGAAAARRDAEVQKQYLQTLFVQAPIAICILRGPQHVVELANNRMLAIWGTPDACVIGRPLAEIRPSAIAADFIALLDRVVASGEAHIGKEHPTRLDGRDVYFDFVYAPMRGASGSIDGVMVVTYEVTEAVRARQQLARTIEYNETFTAMLGHDLRNPLNAISTTAQLLLRRAVTPEIARPAARIERSAERMSRMITQLLDLARARTGGFKLERKPLDLAELCQLVLDELRQANPGARVQVATTGSLHGRWDGDRLAQVISNLAGNALEHGEPRSPVIVELDGRHPDAVSIRVENRGEIAPEVLPVLFDPFRGLGQRNERARGLGLGLYISKEIVTAHHGRIDVMSRGGGTCFEIELPKDAEVLS
jgi:signal transduction histidine kinase/CheY-like chemotaxis protein